MKNFLNITLAFTGSMLLVGCVVEEIDATDYYPGNTTTYVTETTGYNRDYNNRHHHKSQKGYPTGKPTPGSYSSQTVVETIGTPQPSPSYPSGSYPSGSYPSGSYPSSSGSYPSGSPTPATSNSYSQTVVETVG